MTKYGISKLIVGALLLASCGTLVAREPRGRNPCKALEVDLDYRVNSLHRLQNAELAQCRQTNGKKSDVCRKLKSQQELELNSHRYERQAELNRCNPDGLPAILEAGDSSENRDYRVKYPNKPDKPYQPKKPNDPHDPKIAQKPPQNPNGNGSLPRNGNHGGTQSANSSGTHNSSNSSSTSSGSSSPSSSNSSPSTQSSSPSSTSSYSPSSSSSPAPSYSPPSYSPPSAPSQPTHVDTGGARPR